MPTSTREELEAFRRAADARSRAVEQRLEAIEVGAAVGEHGNAAHNPDFATTPHVLNGADHSVTGLTDGHALRATGATTFAFEADYNNYEFIIDGGGAVITTGQKGHLEIAHDGVIEGWTILADQSGSIVVDVWKDVYASFPPTVADTIAGTEKPTLASVQKNQDLALTTWTTTVTRGDILAFNVDSVTTVQRVLVSIRVRKT